METAITYLTLSLYFAASLTMLFDLFRQVPTSRKIVLAFLIVGFVLQIAVLGEEAVRSVQSDHVPFSGVEGSYRFLSWILIGLVLFLRARRGLFALQALLAPAATFCLGITLLAPQNSEASVSASVDFLFATHLLVLFVGTASFLTAVLSALLYFLAQRALKTKRFGGWLGSLPSLETLDRMAVYGLACGHAFLTFGIGIGIYLAHHFWSKSWFWDPKVLLSAATWFWFIVALLFRMRMGWRGARFFALVLVGFLFLLATFAVTSLTTSKHAGKTVRWDVVQWKSRS